MVIVISRFMYHINNREFGEIISVNHMVSDIESLWHDTEFLKEYYLNTRNKVIENCHYGSDDLDAYIEIIMYDGKFREIVISDKNIPSDKIDSVIDNRGMRRLNKPVIVGCVNILIDIYGTDDIESYDYMVCYRTDKPEDGSVTNKLIADNTINNLIKDRGGHHRLSVDGNGRVIVNDVDAFDILITNKYIDDDEYITIRTNNSKYQNN